MLRQGATEGLAYSRMWTHGHGCVYRRRSNETGGIGKADVEIFQRLQLSQCFQTRDIQFFKSLIRRSSLPSCALPHATPTCLCTPRVSAWNVVLPLPRTNITVCEDLAVSSRES